MRNERAEAVFVIFLLGVMLGVFILGVAIHLFDNTVSKVELIEQGYAEYYLDENYERQWRIKE